HPLHLCSWSSILRLGAAIHICGQCSRDHRSHGCPRSGILCGDSTPSSHRSPSMRRLLALSAVFVVLAALAAPWLVGVRAQTLFRHNVANLAEHLQMSIDITRYDRGWFSADAVTELRWGDRRAPVIVQHHITHGPFVAPGWADIESTIVRAHDPLLDYFFDGRSPLAVDTRIQYNGDATIHVSSPTFDKTSPKAPDLSIAWGGFDSKFRISGERHVDYSLQAPKLSIAAADGAIHLQGLALSGFSNMPAGTWQAGSPMDWDSEMLLRLEQARIRSAQENISVQAGLRWHMSTELDTADDLLFDNRLQFRDVDIHPLQGTMPAPFRLDDTALHIRLSGIATAPLADFITRLQALVRYMEVQYGSEGRYGNGRLQAFMERRLPQLLPELLSDRTRLLIEIPSFDSNQ